MEKTELLAAIAYFEDAIRESNEIIAECSAKIKAALLEQRAHFVVALEAMRAPSLEQDCSSNGNAVGWLAYRRRSGVDDEV